MADLSKEIRDWKARVGLSYRQLAALLDVGPDTLHRWAHGRQQPSHPGMLKLAMQAIEEDASPTDPESTDE